MRGQPRRRAPRRPGPEPAAGEGRPRTQQAVLHHRGPQRGAGYARRPDRKGRRPDAGTRREDAAHLHRAEHRARHRHADVLAHGAHLRHGWPPAWAPDGPAQGLGRPEPGRLRGPGPAPGGDRGGQRLRGKGALRRDDRDQACAPACAAAPERHHRQHRALRRDLGPAVRGGPRGRAVRRSKLGRHDGHRRLRRPTGWST